MRTKHLFYTAAMAALFAACVNDDFETIGQQGNVANDGRPVAGDVKLNFTQAGADTRLAFGSNGYAWEADDEIGALLMDNVLTLDEEKSWLEKYQLVNNIHTSYRFYYDSQNKEWKADAKMLEGNYFFAYPWEDYDGRREVAHSLINQEQDGIGGNVVAESYADNQFFIGYSQIKAGTGTNEVLDNSVEMVPLLGAIQLRITNTGTQTYHINKVVLSGHKDLASVLTFDPTKAAYVNPDDANKNWNLVNTKLPTAWGASTEAYFNYANYLGVDGEAELYKYMTTTPGDDDYVYNREDGDKYSRIEALRKVVNRSSLSKEMSAQIVINGTAEERALLPDAQNTAYVLVMSNPLKIYSSTDTEYDGVDGGDGVNNQLLLSIYTDEGFVQNINLAQLYNESADNKVVTDSKIEEVAPNVSNTIGIQIDDNSFVTPDKMDIFNSADLEQFIKWNTAVTGSRNAKATLKQDVTFTADMLAALKANKNTKLTIIGGANIELTLAADVPATVLDEEQIVLQSTAIVVEGELTLTEDSEKAASIEVAKDGKLTIDDPKAVVANIENYGTLTLGANSAVKGITINNYGTMEVVKGGDSKATVTNKKDAVINNNGYMQGVTNEKDATIVLGENATLADVTNSGKIETAKGATVTGANNADGEIVFVDGADISGLETNDGKTSIVYDGTTITKDTKFEKINKIILTKSVTVTDDYTFAGEVELQNNGVLSVNEGKTFTINSLLVSGEGTVSGKGTVKVTTVEVEEETGALTNNGNIEVTVTGSFTNDGIVYNNGYVGIEGGQTAIGYTKKPGTWKYNNATDTTVDTSKQDAMDTAVATWASLWGSWISSSTTDYYNGDPYDYKAFVAAVNGSGNKDMKALKNALKAEGFTDANFETIEDKLVEPAEFATAVDKIVTAANWTALKKEIIDTDGAFTGFTMPSADATLYDTEAEAYDAFAKYVATAEIKNVTDAKVKAAIWKAGETEIADALAETTNGEYIYIWKGCKLDEVMKVYRMRKIAEWDVALNGEGKGWKDEIEDNDDLKFWMSAVLNSENVDNSYVKKAKEVVEKYISEYQTWKYSDGQIENAGK